MRNPLDNLLIKDRELYSLFENFESVSTDIYNRYADQELSVSRQDFSPFRVSKSSDKDVFSEISDDQYNRSPQPISVSYRELAVGGLGNSSKDTESIGTSPNKKTSSRWNIFGRKNLQEEHVEV